MLSSSRHGAAFVHSSWQATRKRVLYALKDSGEPQSRLARFGSCRANFRILRHRTDPHAFKVAPICCRDRFCVPCAAERAQLIQRNLQQRTQGLFLRLLTLTLAHQDIDLTQQIDHLVDAFNVLRKTPIFRDRVTGGCAFLELTRNKTTRLWHPHLHVLMSGHYIPHSHLKAAWYAASRDSVIVDIRAVRDHPSAIRECAKYATKPFPHELVTDHATLVELIRCLKHRKLLYVFGTWRKFRLLTPSDESEWTSLCDDYQLPATAELTPLQRALLESALQTARYLGSAIVISDEDVDLPPNTS